MEIKPKKSLGVLYFLFFSYPNSQLIIIQLKLNNLFSLIRFLYFQKLFFYVSAFYTRKSKGFSFLKKFSSKKLVGLASRKVAIQISRPEFGHKNA